MSALITLINVAASIASTPLFAELNFSLGEMSRVALVGTNGAGKSTLLRIIAGLQAPEKGAVLTRRDLLIEYVPQFVPPEIRDMSLYEGVVEYGRHKRPHLPGWAADMVLHTFDFPTALYAVKFGALSGGEANRALLARAMVVEPNFVLLDEPTNHMDSAAIVRFEHCLSQELRTPFCLVSHDRDLLDHCTNETLFLRDGSLYHFRLPLTLEREELRQHDVACQERLRNERKEIARLTESATKLGVWARQNDKFAGRLQNVRRRIADLQGNVTFVSRERVRELRIDVRAMHANHLLHVEDFSVTVGEGKELFYVEDFALTPGDRVAILGRNGAGKTTFLQAIVHAFQSGARAGVKFHPRAVLGYYDQELRALDANHTPFQHIWQYCSQPSDRISAELIRAGFPYHRHHVPIRTFSGGEQARLHFLTLKLLQPTLMILDEPTNHIDVQGIEMLEDDLLSSAGTVIFVSHDRRFVQQVASRFLLIHEGRLREIASVEPYYALLAQREQKRTVHEQGAKPPSSPSAENTLYRQPSESVEQAILRLEALLATGQADPQQLQTLERRIAKLYDQL